MPYVNGYTETSGDNSYLESNVRTDFFLYFTCFLYFLYFLFLLLKDDLVDYTKREDKIN